MSICQNSRKVFLKGEKMLTNNRIYIHNWKKLISEADILFSEIKKILINFENKKLENLIENFFTKRKNIKKFSSEEETEIINEILYQAPKFYLSQLTYYHKNIVQPKISDRDYDTLADYIKFLIKLTKTKSLAFDNYLKKVFEIKINGVLEENIIVEKNNHKKKDYITIKQSVIDTIQEELDEKLKIKNINFCFKFKLFTNRDTYQIMIQDERTPYKEAIIHLEYRKDTITRKKIFFSTNTIKAFFDLFFLKNLKNEYEIISSKERLTFLGKALINIFDWGFDDKKILEIENRKKQKSYLMFWEDSYEIIEDKEAEKIEKFLLDKNKKFHNIKISGFLAIEDSYTHSNYLEIQKTILKCLNTYVIINQKMDFLGYFSVVPQKKIGSSEYSKVNFPKIEEISYSNNKKLYLLKTKGELLLPNATNYKEIIEILTTLENKKILKKDLELLEEKKKELKTLKEKILEKEEKISKKIEKLSKKREEILKENKEILLIDEKSKLLNILNKIDSLNLYDTTTFLILEADDILENVRFSVPRLIYNEESFYEVNESSLVEVNEKSDSLELKFKLDCFDFIDKKLKVNKKNKLIIYQIARAPKKCE